jgi:hypothetical protein
VVSCNREQRNNTSCYQDKEIERPSCVACGGYAPFLCDYEISPGVFCDKPLCGRCRINMGLKDYCPEHAGLALAERLHDH